MLLARARENAILPELLRNNIPREEMSIWKEMPATSTLNSRSVDWVGLDQNHWRACSKIIRCRQDLKDTKRDSYQINTDINPFWSQIYDALRWYKLTENFDQERRKKSGRSSHLPPRLLVTKSTVRVVQNTFTTAITKYRRTFPSILVFSTKIPSSKRL